MGNEPAAVTRAYQLILWAIPQINKYPRDHRFTLGDRTINHLYELLELLVQASYTRDRAASMATSRSSKRHRNSDLVFRFVNKCRSSRQAPSMMRI